MRFKKLVKIFIPRRLFDAIEPTGHLVESFIWNVIYGFPGKGLKVIGVTGTNGKTSTSFMIHKMLNEAGLRTGLMTTVGYGVEEVIPQVHHMTNVGPQELMKRLKWMKSQNIDWLVLETTSHALAQHRVWGVPYSVAVMTNVTHEHLDYHKTFERYRDAKRRLFKLAKANKKGLQLGILNAEDPSADLFAADSLNSLTYGIDAGMVRATNVELSPGGVGYQVDYEGKAYQIKCKIPGKFNVYNSLAALCVGLKLGLNVEQIEKGLAALEGVEGRMTRVSEGQDYDVIVDFAHTPDSFEKLFKDLKPVVKGKLIVMFGSAGRRDETKRAVQGEIAGKYADVVVVTEEDDRDENGTEILNQIASGAERAGKTKDKDLFLILNRAEAINFAISHAKAGDTVLLLGKGHEKTIEREDREDPWDEIKTAKESIAKSVSLHNQ